MVEPLIQGTPPPGLIGLSGSKPWSNGLKRIENVDFFVVVKFKFEN